MRYRVSTFLYGCDINFGSIGINISGNEETAVPFPYNTILGRETGLPSPPYHSGVTGIDMRRFSI
jgi:hypothetical protein